MGKGTTKPLSPAAHIITDMNDKLFSCPLRFQYTTSDVLDHKLYLGLWFLVRPGIPATAARIGGGGVRTGTKTKQLLEKRLESLHFSNP